MDKKLIPKKLHFLIPLVERWGIEDDGYRDEAIFNATKNELKKIVNSIKDEEANELDSWFCSPDQLEFPTSEYIKFSVYFMAYEYAKSLFRNRNTDTL